MRVVNHEGVVMSVDADVAERLGPEWKPEKPEPAKKPAAKAAADESTK